MKAEVTQTLRISSKKASLYLRCMSCSDTTVLKAKANIMLVKFSKKCFQKTGQNHSDNRSLKVAGKRHKFKVNSHLSTKYVGDELRAHTLVTHHNCPSRNWLSLVTDLWQHWQTVEDITKQASRCNSKLLVQQNKTSARHDSEKKSSQVTSLQQSQ